MAQSFSKETANNYRNAYEELKKGVTAIIGGVEDLDAFVKGVNAEKLTEAQKAALETLESFNNATMKKLGEETEKVAVAMEKADAIFN